MAIEIPSLAADRLPHPEWPPAAPPARFLVPAAAVLAALENAGSPASIIDGLTPVAAAGGSVQLLVAPDRSHVQLLLDGRRIPMTGAARDAVLTLLGGTAGVDTRQSLVTTSSGALDPFLAARVAAVDAQVQEARAHAGANPAGPVELAEPESAAISNAPLMTGPDAAQASRSLVRAVETSGLFLEAHVAQWLRGERSLAQVQDEVHRLPPVTGGATAAASEDRALRQLDAQQNQLLHLRALAWPGQPMDLQISRDPERRAQADDGSAGAGLYQASLSLHLPRLGTVQARIRLLHDTVGLQLAAEQVERLAPALQTLAAALRARGLSLAAIDLEPAVAASHDLQGQP